MEESFEDKALRYMNEAAMENWEIYGNTPEEAQAFFDSVKEHEMRIIKRFLGEDDGTNRND